MKVENRPGNCNYAQCAARGISGKPPITGRSEIWYNRIKAVTYGHKSGVRLER
ncbi:hypothetical protein CLOSTASPAR_04000 [[Clostridium] asparagiforme DSM 15981]|uniref:Uncharacterized protein n=1 Tax=[Clostridium] asparagiforme DSM 15981 TaxID=518636 RepID=C0D408_9FIRM|nr:hypothetical protein CLOSTASPAR_04000 [[Clostridium] asparagiforme DSM 15981]